MTEITSYFNDGREYGEFNAKKTIIALCKMDEKKRKACFGNVSIAEIIEKNTIDSLEERINNCEYFKPGDEVICSYGSVEMKYCYLGKLDGRPVYKKIDAGKSELLDFGAKDFSDVVKTGVTYDWVKDWEENNGEKTL